MSFKLDGTKFKAWTDAGTPAVGYLLYTYASGTTTPKATYTDSTLGGANTNPVVLDARGESDVWLGSGAYTFVLKTAAGVTIDTVDGVEDPQAAADAAIRSDLASTASGKGAALSGFKYPAAAAVAETVHDRLIEWVTPFQFGAHGDGSTDDTAAVQAAIDYVSALSGAAHVGSMSAGTPLYPYGDVRVLDLAGVKFAVSSTITLKNSTTLHGRGGGFIAIGSGWASGAYILDLDNNAYCGAVQDLVIDGNAKDVKGIRIRSAFNTRWHNISVANCRNDGITYTNGAEFMLDQFTVDCASNPVSVSVAGLKLSGGSDAMFTNGTCRFNPVGVYLSGGGNNEFSNIHCWGLYAGQEQYVNFLISDSYRNSFVGCYGDSPTMQDYAQANSVAMNGIPNGGVCFYFANGAGESGAQQNVLTVCRSYVNFTEYTNAALAANKLLYSYMESNCSNNTIANYITAGGVPAGKTDAFQANVFAWSSTSLRDANLVFGSASPKIPALSISRDSFGGVTPFVVENTNNGFSASGGKLRFDVAAVEKGSVTVVQGAGGTSYLMTLAAGSGAVNLNWAGVFYPGTDNAQTLGSASLRWSTVYAGTGAINTSDEDAKQDIGEIPAAWLAAWADVQWTRYRFRDAVTAKGNGARWHVGLVAQRVRDAFSAHGIDATEIGLLCYDEWSDEWAEVFDADGQPVLDESGKPAMRLVRPAGHRWGVRYDEALAMECAYLRSRLA